MLKDPCASASSTIVGQVMVVDEEGQRPLAGVQISSWGANPTISDSFGRFELPFIDKEPGDKVVLHIVKKGYEVINRPDLETIIGKDPDELIEILMCKEGERDTYATTYYKLNEQPTKSKDKKELKESYINVYILTVIAISVILFIVFYAKFIRKSTETLNPEIPIFISYAREDINLAKKLYDDLRLLYAHIF